MTTDTASVARAYIVAIATAALVALWLLLARTPFPTATATQQVAEAARIEQPATVDPRVAALDRRAQQLQARAKRVTARRDARFAQYRRDLAARQATNAARAAAAPSSTWIATGAPSTNRSAPQVSVPASPSTPPVTNTSSS